MYISKYVESLKFNVRCTYLVKVTMPINVVSSLTYSFKNKFKCLHSSCERNTTHIFSGDCVTNFITYIGI